MLTRADAATLLESFDDDRLTRLISELMWFQVTRKGLEQPSQGHLADLKKLMAEAAFEHVLDVLTGEPATDPMPRPL
jgi:hypothetical protein